MEDPIRAVPDLRWGFHLINSHRYTLHKSTGVALLTTHHCLQRCFNPPPSPGVGGKTDPLNIYKTKRPTVIPSATSPCSGACSSAMLFSLFRRKSVLFVRSVRAVICIFLQSHGALGKERLGFNFFFVAVAKVGRRHVDELWKIAASLSSRNQRGFVRMFFFPCLSLTAHRLEIRC